MDYQTANNNEYTLFESRFLKYVNHMIEWLNKHYMSHINLQVYHNKFHKFSEVEKCYGAYLKSYDFIYNDVIVIGLNISHIFECMKKLGTSEDELNIEAQARITVCHETAHGLIDYIINVYNGNSKLSKQLVSEYNNDDFDEEYMAEEFGKYMLSSVTEVKSSRIADIIIDMIKAETTV